MIHLRKERFPRRRGSKLHPRADGPFKVLKQVNDNSYKIELSGRYDVSGTFNVADLSPYHSEDGDHEESFCGEEEADSETNCFQSDGE